MSSPLENRHYLSVTDFTAEELGMVLETARRVKRNPSEFAHAMDRKVLAMIFQKPSLRTRVSFETGMAQMGGHAIYLAPSDISLGTREIPEDVAMTISRMADAIMARVFGHGIVEELARYARVPVINGLSDFEHPCQTLADLETIIERRGRLENLHCCYIGDGNNVAHSLMFGGALTGMHVTVITPEGYEPGKQVCKRARKLARATGARIETSNDLGAVRGADVLYTDVWASMGQESEAKARKRIFQSYRIDDQALEQAADDAIILHCLPAHYGDEIDYATSRRPNSAIFEQAENRLHAQKALLLHLLGRV
jgi:ornithine carbamoyltransferase